MMRDPAAMQAAMGMARQMFGGGGATGGMGSGAFGAGAPAPPVPVAPVAPAAAAPAPAAAAPAPAGAAPAAAEDDEEAMLEAALRLSAQEEADKERKGPQ